MTRRIAALGAIAAMVLAGCALTVDPRPTPSTPKLPEPGQCIAKEIRDLDSLAPDYASVIDCKKPHAYEIVDVLNVPKKFLANGSREERLERRTQLAKSTAAGSLAEDLRDHTERECRRSVLRATGLSDVSVDEASAYDARVRPVLAGARTWTSFGPARAWAAGKATIVCSFRYVVAAPPGDLTGDVHEIRSSSSAPAYRDLLTRKFPADRRACGSYDSDNYMFAVLCTDQHNVEALFSYEADAVFGKKFIDSVDGDAPTDAEWDKLVTPCADSLETVIGAFIDEDLAGSVYLSDDWNSSDTPTAYCLVAFMSDKYDLPPGSVVRKAREVKEVRAKEGEPLGSASRI